MKLLDVSREMAVTICTRSMGGIVCGAEPVATFAVGCAHEHVTEFGVCATHLESVQEAQWTCNNCAVGPEPHECFTRLTRTGAPA